MYIPKLIRQLIDLKEGIKDEIGMSGSMVFLYPHHVLKIREHHDGTLKKEYDVLNYLQGKLKVPKVITYQCLKKYDYLLISRLEGEILSQSKWMNEPFQLIDLMAQSLKKLWAVDISNLNIYKGIPYKLKLARHNIDTDDVDTTQAEEGTYGPNGFIDPEDLYKYLEREKPDEDKVFSHGDLTLENMLVNHQGEISWIDFDRGGVACRYVDIALSVRNIYHHLGYDTKYMDYLFDQLGIDPDWHKIKYYILLDELM